MKPKRGITIVAAAAMIVAAASVSPAAAKKTPPPAPSGNLNLRIEGYEVVTNSTDPSRVSIEGIGQLLSDTAGSLSGVETFTAVDPTGSSSETVCNGSVTGQITAPSGGFASGSGQFGVTLSYVPASGAGAICVATTATMLCNRTLGHPIYVNDLDAGEYHCLVTGLTGTGISAASMSAHLGSVSGSNAPTN